MRKRTNDVLTENDDTAKADPNQFRGEDKGTDKLGLFSSSKRVFALCLAKRMANALLVQTYFNLDERWQALEVAHRITFGYGHLTWEWKKGIRSYLHPMVFAALYKVLALFHLDTPWFMDHKKYLAEREFVALKERAAGKRVGFKRVSCINATLPLSQMSSLTDNLSAACKFSDDGEDRVVVGTLDLNQCIRLPDEITGKKPEGIGADFARAYVSNVCVAEELQRNGLGFALVAKSKIVAQEWGISDLYVHVAVDNEPAKHLYVKSGFVYESDEPAWQARFLDRPRRILLWAGIPHTYDL